jgi:hypothetical protein
MARDKNLKILEQYCKKYNITNHIYSACANVSNLLGHKDATYPIQNKYLNLFFDITKFQDRYGKQLQLNDADTSSWISSAKDELNNIYSKNNSTFFKKIRAINGS